jgi:hypothetical protein
MMHQNVLRAVLAGALLLLMEGIAAAPSSSADEGGHSAHDVEMEHHSETGAVESMTPQHQHTGPHMKWTTLRPPTPEDITRAEQIVHTLREVLAKYKDYHVALQEGFEPFHPEIPVPHYHFTSKANGFKAAFGFNPAAPTSLLYKKTGNGYELEGAMYTAPKRTSEERLNERVPLSVAQWHAHVNVCLPPEGINRRMDWAKFGFKGSLATEQECQQAGGQFFPQIYGWMLHVYPFEQSQEKIWTH